MNFSKLFAIVLLAALAFLGQTEAGGLKKFGKRLERVGKHVFEATAKALPVVAGINTLGPK
ncbi:cecropin-A2 [Culex quinquefasciatus]|uniref:cecropin-A2 n=1 Tax=Culex quinquefasciatus TaxID=7176 RepID=UPI0018E33912|nr:cecropin-A2 [Culex quinquefasciatus]XP_039447068.1 cecropin-A2-like [Culex pipiens pallens]